MEIELIEPLDYHIHYIKTGACRFCHQSLRHPLHAFHHWKKWHNKTITISQKPRYFVWYEDEWVETNMEVCMSAMLEKRAYAITKPRNVENKSRGN